MGRRANHPPKMEGVKECKGCGETKHITQFGVEPHNLDGRRGKCKTCVSAYDLEFRRKQKAKKLEQVVPADKLDAAKSLGFPYVLGRMVW